MKILIIGGTGLISTPITRKLLGRGHTVTHLNRGRRGDCRGVTRLTGDRSQHAEFEKLMQRQGEWDCVIDMWCMEPTDAHSLVRAFRQRTAQLIVCSTVDVYARPTRRFPIVENEPLGGVSDYGKKKAECERILQAAHVRGDFQVTLIRPCHTYDDGGAIHNATLNNAAVLGRLRQGLPVILHGDGQGLWESVHAEDCSEAFVNAVGNPHAFGKAYHTGGAPMTWEQKLTTVCTVFSWPAPTFVHIPANLLFALSQKRGRVAKENFQFDNLFDSTAAQRDLGYLFTITWEQGVTRMKPVFLFSPGKIADPATDPEYDRLLSVWDRHSRAMVAELVPGTT